MPQKRMLKSHLIQMLRLLDQSHIYLLYLLFFASRLPGEQFSAGFRLQLKIVESALLKLLMISARVNIFL